MLDGVQTCQTLSSELMVCVCRRSHLRVHGIEEWIHLLAMNDECIGEIVYVNLAQKLAGEQQVVVLFRQHRLDKGTVTGITIVCDSLPGSAQLRWSPKFSPASRTRLKDILMHDVTLGADKIVRLLVQIAHMYRFTRQEGEVSQTIVVAPIEQTVNTSRTAIKPKVAKRPTNRVSFISSFTFAATPAEVASGNRT